MNAITTAKMKCSAIADKVANSKVYKGAEKLAVTAGATLATVGMTGLASFAEEGVNGGVDLGSTVTAAANVSNILNNAAPFIEPAIVIMCAVAGLRLGMKFLRGSAK